MPGFDLLHDAPGLLCRNMHPVCDCGIGFKVRLWRRSWRDEHADHAFRAAAKNSPSCVVAAVSSDRCVGGLSVAQLAEPPVSVAHGRFGVAGQIVGWLLFDYLSDRVLTGSIGVVGMLTALNYAASDCISRWRDRWKPAARMMRRVWVRAPLFCGLSGLASFVLDGRHSCADFPAAARAGAQAFVGTMSVYFFVINIVKLPFYSELDLIRPETPYLSPGCYLSFRLVSFWGGG